MTASIASSSSPSFVTGLVRSAVALLASLAATAAFAQGEPREGVNYSVVKPEQPTSAPTGKVEVIEFFGYWCPHCNDFEPTMNDWARRNEAKVQLLHVPIAFASVQSGLQKLYYTLDVLGKEKELRAKVFASIHGDHSLSAAPDIGAMADWAAKNGIDKKVFLDTYNSFAVQTRFTKGNQMATAYGVTGVPMLAIGGKYLLNVDARSIGNADFFLGRVSAGK